MQGFPEAVPGNTPPTGGAKPFQSFGDKSRLLSRSSKSTFISLSKKTGFQIE
jgi:hypothetical protein